jgi:hypothetical protein
MLFSKLYDIILAIHELKGLEGSGCSILQRIKQPLAQWDSKKARNSSDQTLPQARTKPGTWSVSMLNSLLDDSVCIAIPLQGGGNSVCHNQSWSESWWWRLDGPLKRRQYSSLPHGISTPKQNHHYLDRRQNKIFSDMVCSEFHKEFNFNLLLLTYFRSIYLNIMTVP